MRIHYFQRYHQKENVATANTMLLLSRLYQYDPSKFFDLLNSIAFQSQDFDPEVSIGLQMHNGTSTPDAVISQNSFKVVIEVKITDWFKKIQLINHLESFESEDYSVLMTLASEPMAPTKLLDVNSQIQNYNKKTNHHILHTNTTFSELIEKFSDVLDEQRDQDMIDVLEDFIDFCHHDGLITESESWKFMKAYAAWQTYDFNMTNGLYYHDMNRRDSPHDYVGLYVNKSVRAVGKIDHIVTAFGEPNNLTYIVEYGEFAGQEPPQWIKDKIASAIVDGRNYGYVLDSTKYFFVDKFEETDFRKTTKYPPRGPRVFNLEKILGIDHALASKELANQLNGKTWS